MYAKMRDQYQPNIKLENGYNSMPESCQLRCHPSPLHNMKKINCLKHYMPCFPLSLVEYNTCTLLFSSDLSRCCQYGIIYNTSFGSLGPKNTMSICLYILVVDYTENMEICLLPRTQHVGESLRGV